MSAKGTVPCNAGNRAPVGPRFQAKVYMCPMSGCWLWTGAANGFGYGGLQINRKNTRAHRVSWELHFGSIPAGLDVLHRCDIPSCVNPNHLFLGTDSDNQKDRVRKGRHYEAQKTHCPRGHEYTPANTYLHRGKKRRCRKCQVAITEKARRLHPEKRIARDRALRAKRLGIVHAP